MALLATVISRVFDPFIMLAALLVMTFLRGGEMHLFTWIAAFGLMVGAPVTFRIIAVQRKIISDWDISRRRERPRMLGLILLLEILNVLLIRPFVSAWITQTLIGIFVVIGGFTLITLRWKISGHVLTSALFTGAVVAWFGWNWWPALLIAPLVGWARVVGKRHTVGQVVAGALYAWGLVLAYTLAASIS